MSLFAGLSARELLFPTGAMAACTPPPAANTATTCGTTTLTNTLGSGPSGPDNSTIIIQSGASVRAGNFSAISLRDAATITLQNNSTVTNNATSGGGLYGAGRDTIEFRSFGTLTIGEGATLSSLGSANTAEAVNLMGQGNTVINRGTISAVNNAAIWFEDQVIGAANTIDNFGIIRRGSGTQPVTENSIGSQADGDVNFINRTGAIVYGGLSFARGDDTLTLFPSSVVTGGFNGGGGTNTLTLAGEAGTSDTLAGNISNFQTLTKTGDGTWTLTGTVGTNSGTPLAVRVQQGTLVLTGNNTNFNGSVVVDPAGILEARAQSLPPAITDNGLVRFAQPDNGTYGGVISGTGRVAKTGAGVLTLSGVNTYQGGTTIQGGTIAINADSRLGASGGPITLDGGTLALTSSFNLSPSRAITVTANDGTIQANAGVTSTVSQAITGAGALTKAGTGTLVLSGSNTYAGGTTISAGTLQLGNGGATGSILGNLTNNGTLAFNRSNEYQFDGLISGSGSLVQAGDGQTILTGNNTYTGTTTVSGGYLFVNGDQSAATGLTSVETGARLSGSGTIGGNVTVADDAIFAPGHHPFTPATLTINGDLALSDASNVFYNLVTPGEGGALNDLTNIGGDLTLDGVINVLDPGAELTPGVYRIFNYDGTLIDNTMTVGAFLNDQLQPTGRTMDDFFVQVSIPGQVNLVNTAGLELTFWDGDAGPKDDGVINGGVGTWRIPGGVDPTTDDWTDATGEVNAPWDNGQFAIFTGTAAVVTVDNDNGQVQASGMQFMTDGYEIAGDPLTLVAASDGASVIRVGGGPSDPDVTATISAILQGSTTLQKTGGGTLVLEGVNTYAGGTIVAGGTLEIAADNNLGAAGTGLSINGATLHTTADITSARATTLGAAGGTFETDTGTAFTLNGAVSGGGALTKTGAGTTVLAAANTYSGGTTISAGTLQLGSGGASGSIVGNVANSGTLAFNRNNTYVFGGVVSGTGSLEQMGSGTTAVTSANTYSGGTTISDGTLQLGNGGATGSIVGNVLTEGDGALAFNRSNTYTFGGTISGTGSVSQTGSGITILTGDNSYTGATTITNGWLYIDGDQSVATGPTTAASGTRLGGSGIVGGDVTIADGATLSPGAVPQTPATLTINGNLNLNPNSILFYNMVEANVAGGQLNDLTEVGGDLVLDGVINLVDTGEDLGPGVYRVINYDGALINMGLTIGSYMTAPATPQETPVATGPLTGFSVQTSIPGQVNLINTSGLSLTYWDGDLVTNENNNVIDGGVGTWRNAGATDNWTNSTGLVNATWADGQFAIFAGTAATVTVNDDNGQVQASGMQFMTDGYVIAGDSINLVDSTAAPDFSVIRVGDGTEAGAAITATINSVLSGSTTLEDRSRHPGAGRSQHL
jgi:fibronectin-binding autotransporter adhesin